MPGHPVVGGGAQDIPRRPFAQNPVHACGCSQLALGIGANTAIFGLVDALLLRPLPVVKAPGQLVLLMRGDGRGPALSYPDFTVLRERNEVLSDLALYTQAPISFGNNVHSEIVLGAMVSANYFDVLGIKPSLGRAFLPEEDRTPAHISRGP